MSKKTSETSHWLILILLALAQFMVVLDVSIVNVALPTIQHVFGMTQSTLQWIITAYTIAFGGFLLFGGRAADLFGRRKIFLSGILLFTLASLANGLAQSSEQIIIFRAIQGLAGAFMSPAALSIILVTYREGHERNVALSVWGAVAAGGAAFGVLLGGILTQYLSWRWIFFINVPIGLFVILTSLRILDKHEKTVEHSNLDLTGAILVTSGLITLVYALVKAPINGWLSTSSLTLLGIAIVALVGFVYNESRTKHPLMPLSIFKIRNLSGANALQLFTAGSIFSVFFFVTLYLQEVLGYSPLKTGLSFLIVPFVVGLTASNVPKVIAKIGYKKILVVAPLFISSGLFYLSHVPINGTFWGNVAPGMILFAFGMGATFVSITIAATSGVPHHEAGLASGILNTAQQVGGAIGLAVLAGLVTSTSADYIKGLNLHRVPSHDVIAAGMVHGFQRGFLVASTFGIAASLIAVFVIKQKKGDPITVNPEAALGA